ncbi:hypothetical protein BIT28_10215 [Photobacterium proteolyticum]|uniref:Heptosyltransferase n=1 Tax=Photobacterium proteolyticum TaxID=1903952 RepID=A0A1Q9GT43_9GAMM|nr:glycosyltransferase family 9 protein [Photobacterium proteolyticum]OLQ78273.1 hypothetical protein BIT28_10215 [Photobacterium proteolyticum]
MLVIKDFLRKFDKWRRVKMSGLEPGFYHLFNNKNDLQDTLVSEEDIKSILIIRNNKRIGNVLFMIPFVRQVRKDYPNAKITLMLNEKWQGQFFDNIGVDNIFYSELSFVKILSTLKLILKLKKETFSMILLPNSSAGDTVLAAMLRSKNKISPYNEKCKGVFSHSVKLKKTRPHSALMSLEIIESLRDKGISNYCHQLSFSDDELTFGLEEKKKLDIKGRTLTIAYFRGARGIKVLPDSYWEKLLEKFNAATDDKICWVEILSPDIEEALTCSNKSYSSTDIRLLGSVLRSCDAFISCDTGPLHLADASGATCVGLFNITDPAEFGVLGNDCFNVTDIYNVDCKSIISDIKDRKLKPDNYSEVLYNSKISNGDIISNHDENPIEDLISV